jgi:hypothetical protein
MARGAFRLDQESFLKKFCFSPPVRACALQMRSFASIAVKRLLFALKPISDIANRLNKNGVRRIGFDFAA